MDEKTTRKAAPLGQTLRPPVSQGLLRFFPLGTPPGMSFFALSRDVAFIGRGSSCSIVLDDEEASREHACLERSGKSWTITDCGSTNGVSVNGQRVVSASLVGGEILRIGTTLLRFMDRGVAEASEEVPVHTSGLVGGPALTRVRKLLDRAASSDITVLIAGETGTGKELAALHLHQATGKTDAPFIPVNCAALPSELLESELFGHVKGAFSGATEDAPGLIRQAHGGMLFLDEIGEIPVGSQAKLLRVLQDHRVRPVGSTRSVPVDVRVVCATNQDLGQRVEQGTFRLDLYARISELTIQLPTLAQKAEDIPLLTRHFLQKQGRDDLFVPVDVLELLCCQRWPSNVRQLESAVRRAILLAADEPALTMDHFTSESLGRQEGGEKTASRPAAPDLAHPLAVELDRVLREHSGDVERAAQQIGISRSQLYRRARKFGIDVPSYRNGELAGKTFE